MWDEDKRVHHKGTKNTKERQRWISNKEDYNRLINKER
jgi:hypothetical protein